MSELEAKLHLSSCGTCREAAARIAALEAVATAAQAFINAGSLDMDRFQYNRLRELRDALAALAPAPAPEGE